MEGIEIIDHVLDEATGASHFLIDDGNRDFHIWTADGARAVAWTIEGGGEGEPLTPEEQLDELKGVIAVLKEAGALNRGQANSMTKKVDNALKKIGQGKTKPAINMLNALINQINDFELEGILTLEQAQLLRGLAQGAIDGLSGG